MNKVFSILIFLCLLMTHCRNVSKDINSNKYRIKKTFLQEDNGLTKLWRIEKFDSIGKPIEMTQYENELISSVSRIYYDSLYRPIIIKIISFNSIEPNLTMIYQNYNSRGLLAKKIWIDNVRKDTSYQFYEYDLKGRLIKNRNKQQYRGSKNEFFEEYYYDNDSLCKSYFTVIDGLKRHLKDSIVYLRDRKIVFTLNALGGFDKKFFFYKNGMLIRDTDIYCENIYIYNSANKLIKKEQTIPYDGCVIDPKLSNETKRIYTYFYE